MKRLLRVSKSIIDDIVNDPTTKELFENTRRLAEDIFLDNNGKPVLKPEALQQLKVLLTSLALEQLRDVPLPPIRGSTEHYDYVLDGVKLSAWEILPKNITITSLNKFSVNTEEISSEAYARVVISMNEITAGMKNVKFAFRRKNSVIHVHDEGVADVSIKEPGASLVIDLEALSNHTENFIFSIKKVNFRLGNLKFHIIDSKYDWLLNLLSPILIAAIRTNIESDVESKLKDLLSIIAETLNHYLKDNKVSRQLHQTGQLIKEELQEVKKQKDAIEQGSIVPQ